MDTTVFVKQLASNNRKVRDNALDTVQKYLSTKSFQEAKQLQFNKLWKGLYFAMWFSDRPRPQQRLANELAALHMLYFRQSDNSSHTLTQNDKAFLKFCRGFWKVISIEWLSIDRYRLDKFLLLVRRVLFNQLAYLEARQWDDILVDAYINKVLKWLPLSADPKVPNGIPLHIIDILLEEWERLLKPDDDDDEAEDKNNDKKVKETEEVDMATLVKGTPLPKILEIFSDVFKDTNNSKVFRTAIKEELFTDARLAEWDVKFELPVSKKQEESEDDVDSSSDSENEDTEEWHGF